MTQKVITTVVAINDDEYHELGIVFGRFITIITRLEVGRRPFCPSGFIWWSSVVKHMWRKIYAS